MVEEIAIQCELLGDEIRNKVKVRTQSLMFEVFKRVVNEEQG